MALGRAIARIGVYRLRWSRRCHSFLPTVDRPFPSQGGYGWARDPETTMNYPLFLKFTGTTLGRGFVAKIEFDGRLLGVKSDDDHWWLHGVNPSAIAEQGASLDEANERLRDALRESLAWFASQAEDFEAFQTYVERFVKTTNEDYLAEWNTAVQRVRAGKECIGGMPIKASFSAVSVSVSRKAMNDLDPGDNLPSSELATAAAAA
jgi:hypothetical protein